MASLVTRATEHGENLQQGYRARASTLARLTAFRALTVRLPLPAAAKAHRANRGVFLFTGGDFPRGRFIRAF